MNCRYLAICCLALIADSSIGAETGNKVSAPYDRLAAAEAEIADLKFRIFLLETSMEKKADVKSSATFDPARSQYQRIDTYLGAFAVSITDVKPFADGVVLTVNLGNLTSASFPGAHLDIAYGPRFVPLGQGAKLAEKLAAGTAWQKALKKYSTDLTTELKPGHWNPSRVVLPDIRPDGFGHVELTLTVNSALMNE